MHQLTNRYFLKLSYTGTNYHGWQKQPNSISVQEKVEEALSTILCNKTGVVGAGRTDTGVHAREFYAHFDAEHDAESLQSIQLQYKLNSLLPPDIAVHDIIAVQPGAHARFSALSRSYMYYICTRKDPFLDGFSWQFTRELDIEALEQASRRLMEHDDFSSFARSNTQVSTHICAVYEATWTRYKNTLVFKITANRFLRNMVRAIVGTLVDVGLKKLTPDGFNQIILDRDRRSAGYSAPACGLYLTEIQYPDTIFI